MDGTEIERLIVRLVGDASSYIKMLEESASKTTEKADEIAKEAERLAQSFTNQASTMNMTGREAQLYRLQMGGATEAQLASARAAAEQLDHFEAQKNSMARGAQVTQSAATAAEHHKEKIADLNRLLQAGSISQETYRRATEAAKKELVAQTQAGAGAVAGMQSFAQQALGLFAGLGLAVGAIAAFEKFAAFEQTQLQLKAVIQSNGHAVTETMQRYNEFAAEISKTSLLTKGQTLNMLRQAEAQGLSGTAAERAIKSAQGLAGALGGDAEGYLRMSIAAERGEYFHLKHALGMRHVSDEAKILERYQNVVTAGLAAQKAKLESASGQIELLKRSFAGLTVEVGGLVARGLLPLIQLLRQAVDWFNGLDPSIRSAVAQLIALVAVLGTLKSSVAVLGMLKGGFVGWGGGIALVAGALFALQWVINNTGSAAKELDDRLKEILDKRDRLTRVSEAKTAATLSQGRDILDPERRKDFYKGEMDKAAAEVKQKQADLEDLQRQQRKLEEDARVVPSSPALTELSMGGGLVGAVAGGLNRFPDLLRGAAKAIDPKAAQVLEQNVTNAEKALENAKKAAESLGDAFAGIDLSREGRANKAITDMERLTDEIKKQRAEVGLSGEEFKISEALKYTITEEGLKKIQRAQEELFNFNYEKNAEKVRQEVNKVREELEEETAAWNKTSLEISIYQAAAGGVIGTQRETERALARVANQVKINKAIEDGASDRQIARLKKEANAQDQQREKFDLLKEAAKIVQDNLTPAEKLAQEQARLTEVFMGTNLSATAYARALEKAADAAGKLQGRQAALAGSAEAVSRIMEYQDSLRYGERVNRTARVAEAQKAGGAEGLRIAAEQRDKLKEIKEILEKIAAKPAGVAAAAGTAIVEGALLVGAGLAGGG